MGKCAICNGDSASLLYARHKDLGYIRICQKCWENAYDKNRLVCDSGSSGGGCCR